MPYKTIEVRIGDRLYYGESPVYKNCLQNLLLRNYGIDTNTPEDVVNAVYKVINKKSGPKTTVIHRGFVVEIWKDRDCILIYRTSSLATFIIPKIHVRDEFFHYATNELKTIPIQLAIDKLNTSKP